MRCASTACGPGADIKWQMPLVMPGLQSANQSLGLARECGHLRGSADERPWPPMVWRFPRAPGVASAALTWRFVPELLTSASCVPSRFAATILIAFNRGGYYPTAWGWIALAAAATACRARFRHAARLSARGRRVLAALALLCAIVALSSLWGAPARAMLEAERGATYLLVLTAVLAGFGAALSGRRSSEPGPAARSLQGMDLLTRLLPERLGVVDPVARIRLAEPLGYLERAWRLLCDGASARSRLRRPVRQRQPCGSSAPPACRCSPRLCTSPTAAEPGSRWDSVRALRLLVDRRRLHRAQLPFPLALVGSVGPVLAYRSGSLNRVDALLADAAADGAAAMSLPPRACRPRRGYCPRSMVAIERHWSPAPVMRRAFAAALVVTAVASLVGLFIRLGPPHTVVLRAYHGFAAPPPAVGVDVSDRLFSWSGTGRVPQWRVARDDFERAPVIGNGAGTYEIAWNELRPYPVKIRDAHSLLSRDAVGARAGRPCDPRRGTRRTDQRPAYWRERHRSPPRPSAPTPPSLSTPVSTGTGRCPPSPSPG